MNVSHSGSGSQMGSGHQVPQYTTSQSASIIDSEIILDSATLPQSSTGHAGYHSLQAPSSASVIDSEIIIPDEEPILFSNVHDPGDFTDPPFIHHHERDRSLQEDRYIIAEQQRERRPPPVHSYRINANGNFGAPQYSAPPPQRELQYTIPPPQHEPKKVPLDQMSHFGKPASTIVIYESGPSNKPLPQKVDQPAQRSDRRLRDRRCFCCFMVFLVILLFLIVIALAIVIPLLRLYE